MSFFTKFLDVLRARKERHKIVPQQPANMTRLPPTFGPKPGWGESEKDFIFDPSMTHYARAFRRGDPKLPEAEMLRWQTARRQAMMHLLSLAVDSPWGRHLVLRGSLALRASLGGEAREPGDIDWVVQPPEMEMTGREAKQMMDGIILMVKDNARCGGDVTILKDDITRTDIWIYDRAPGHRVAFPWSCGNLPAAVVQMDFVFQQKLHTAPELSSIRLGELPEVRVMTASEEESLAWKILWLYSDSHPQGKDLYDAVLLAEKTRLTGTVLKAVLEDAGRWENIRLGSGFPFRVPFNVQDSGTASDWDNFVKECPWVMGTPTEWEGRLISNLAPATAEIRRMKEG